MSSISCSNNSSVIKRYNSFSSTSQIVSSEILFLSSKSNNSFSLGEISLSFISVIFRYSGLPIYSQTVVSLAFSYCFSNSSILFSQIFSISGERSSFMLLKEAPYFSVKSLFFNSLSIFLSIS